MSVSRDSLRRRRRRELVDDQDAGGRARVPRLRRTQHVHGGCLPEESESLDARHSDDTSSSSTGGASGGSASLVAASSYPLTDQRPNIPSASVRLPAVADYEQVD